MRNEHIIRSIPINKSYFQGTDIPTDVKILNQ